jgi:Ca2+-binding RTX toxin-like protein
LRGDDGNDDLDGGDGDDVVTGGVGRDHLRGGLGNDSFENDAEDDLFDDDRSSSSQSGNLEIRARLTAVGGGTAIGSSKYEREGGKTEFEISVSGALSGTYNVLVGGVNVGVIKVNARGTGKLELQSRREDAHEQLLPANFPVVSAGTTVVIEGLVSGAF